MALPTAMSSSDSGQAWRERSRVVFTPVAAPAVLGWCTFAIASLLLGSHLAGWWGGDATLMHLAPFLLFIGTGQFIAGMWGFRAREPMATLIHGVWGCLWLGFGLAYTLAAFELFAIADLRMPLGFMLLAAAIITLAVVIAAVFENLLLSILAAVVAIAAGITGIGLLSDTIGLVEVGGWAMVVAAAFGWYFATAILVAEATGKQRLPIGDYRMTTDLPGEPTTHAVAYNTGMPLFHTMVAGNGGEETTAPTP